MSRFRAVRLGPLDATIVEMTDGLELFIDWHAERVNNRWRIVLAWQDLFVSCSETYGYRPGPRRWRFGPLRVAWYAPGVE